MPRRPPTYLLPAAAILLGVIHFFVYHQRMLEMPLRFNDDVVQHYLWLFDTDWGDDFYARTSGQIQPWGFALLLRTAALLLDPLTISRYGPLLVTVLIATYGTLLLRRFVPAALALAGAYLLCQYTLYVGVGCLARSFCIPLLLAFAYYLLADRRRGIAAAFLASGLFYPPALLINGCIYAVWEGGRWLLRLRDRHYPRHRWPHWRLTGGGALLAGLLVVVQSYRIATSPDLGAMLSLDELTMMPEFGDGGRVGFKFLAQTPVWTMTQYYLRAYFGTEPGPDVALAILAAAALAGLIARRRLGRFAVYLFLFWAVTVGLYAAARQLLPALFLPDRYYQYPWRLAVPLTYLLIVAGLYSLWPRRWLSVLLVLPVAWLGYRYVGPREMPLVGMDDRAAVFTALGALPDTAVIAAPPQLASFIPLLSERSVFISHEAAHALYFRHYYDYVTPRYAAYVEAVTDPDPTAVLTFLDRYGIDYLLIDPRLNSSLYGLFAPHQQRFNARRAALGPDGPAVARIAAAIGRPLNDEVSLVSREELRAWLR